MADKDETAELLESQSSESYGAANTEYRLHKTSEEKHANKFDFLHQSAVAFLTPVPCRLPTKSQLPADYEGPTEFKYITPGKENFVFKRMLKILHDNRERRRKEKRNTFIAAFLVIIGLFVDGLRPISLIWAKNGESSYPFSFSLWIVVTKSLVVAFSVLMYYMAPKETRVTTMAWFDRFKLSFLLLPPVVLYVISDSMNFYMFELISASTFSVVKQSRLVIVALLYRFVLQRFVSRIQWIAVVQLALASLLFEAENLEGGDSEGNSQILGISLLLFKCLLDSLAIIWMDKYFKLLDESGFPYPQQQVFFSVYSVLVGVVMTLYQDGGDILFSGKPLFHGWNRGAWLSAFLAAFYGLLISIVLRYLNSMVKMFQSLGAVIVTIVFDRIFFGQVITPVKGIAVCFVMISVFLYKMGTVKKK